MKRLLLVCAALLLVMAGVVVLDGMGRVEKAQTTAALQALGQFMGKVKADKVTEKFSDEMEHASTFEVVGVALLLEVGKWQDQQGAAKRTDALLAVRPVPAVFGQSLVFLLPGLLLLLVGLGLTGKRKRSRGEPCEPKVS